MSYDPDRHHRRSIRLQNYDYAQANAYFLTICVLNRECLLGEIIEGEMRLSAYGHIVTGCWLWLMERYSYLDLDYYIVMPNHLHGILIINHQMGDSRVAPTVKRKPLGQLVGAFKTVSTKFINNLRDMEGVSFWQRNYYEHIIRDERDLNRIREYIVNNPGKWAEDEDNPVNVKSS